MFATSEPNQSHDQTVQIRSESALHSDSLGRLGNYTKNLLQGEVQHAKVSPYFHCDTVPILNNQAHNNYNNIACVSGVRHRSKDFTGINSFNPHPSCF